LLSEYLVVYFAQVVHQEGERQEFGVLGLGLVLVLVQSLALGLVLGLVFYF